MTSDLDLLGQFARENSQNAFAALVQRHLNLVYSAALRQVRSPQLAEEVAQSVFNDLAQNAGKLSNATGSSLVLTAWLYRVTRRTAIDVIRKESRRQLREQIAVEMTNMNATSADWTQIEPLLDDAMAALDETDRTAVLLRYFENKSLRDVGDALSTSEDAAQKRVSRAVERLREFFSKRNVTMGASGLAVLISANAVQSAPVSLAQTIITTIPRVAGVSLGATFFASVLGKTLIGAGAVAIVFLGAGIYFHVARQFSSGKFQTEGSQGVLANGNPGGLNSHRSILDVSKTATGGNDDPKLDEAIAHLRIVLHTRPTTHQMYDYEQITNAIEKFGNKKRLAFNILRENVGDSEEFVRAGACAGIGFIGKSVPEAAPFLWNVLYYSSSSRDHWFIFRALQNIEFGPWDLPALTELLADPISNDNILTELVPETIAEQIARNPQTAKPYLPAIEKLLDDPNPDTQFRAALALIKAEGAHNPKVFSALHALFQRQNNRQSEYYKNLAVQIVGDTGPVARPLVPDLLDFAKSAGEIGVQEATYQAIAKIEPDLNSQIPGVARAIKEQQDDKMWGEKWKSGSYTFDDLRVALKDRSQALTAADHLVEMGAEAKGAVPGMIKALWGKDEDTRNAIVTDIHKIDPSVVITKINMTGIYTGGAHEVLDKQPDTQQNKILKGDLVTLELFSGWCLPEELAAFTNKLAAQDPDAYRAFVKDNKPQNE